MSKTQTLIILCGEAFSGKTTLSNKIANNFGAKVVGRDEIYFAVEKILALENTPDEDDHYLWKNLWPLVLQGVKNQFLLGNSVVIDDNCLYLRQRDELRSIVREIGVKSLLIFLDIPAEVLKQRKEQNKMSKNRHDVPSAWLTEDSEIFERPTEKENPIIYTSDETLDAFVDKIKI
jgi:predicted kinase